MPLQTEPSELSIQQNAYTLARYAIICQENGLVSATGCLGPPCCRQLLGERPGGLDSQGVPAFATPAFAGGGVGHGQETGRWRCGSMPRPVEHGLLRPCCSAPC